MRRLLQRLVLFDRQAFNPLPRLRQLLLAELQEVAAAGGRGDRLFQAELAFFERAQRVIEPRERLLVGQRLVEGHGMASSTVASSRPAESNTLTGCPLRACSALRMMSPPLASSVML